MFIMIARRVYLQSITLLGCLWLFSQCNVLKPQMPAENYNSNLRRPQTSIINLYADLEVSKLERLINEHVDSVLYQDTSFTDNGNDNLKVKVWKTADVRLKFEQR